MVRAPQLDVSGQKRVAGRRRIVREVQDDGDEGAKRTRQQRAHIPFSPCGRQNERGQRDADRECGERT